MVLDLPELSPYIEGWEFGFMGSQSVMPSIMGRFGHGNDSVSCQGVLIFVYHMPRIPR
jgi:hypothetical protein